MSKLITFVSSYDGFKDIEELRPYPALKNIPQWYKDIPLDIDNNKYKSKLIPNLRTAKTCPSFIDILQEGFILPAHTDMHFRVEDDGTIEWKTANPSFNIELHNNNQFVNHTNTPIRQVFKIIYPYHVIVPKGYSIRQMPLIWDYNKDWHISYGTFKADKIPEIALQLNYTSTNNEIYIKAGTPLCQYIPYKRESFKMEIGDYKDYHDIIWQSWHRASTSFKHSYRRNIERWNK